MNTSTSPEASSARRWQACGFPTHPAGSGPPRITRTRGSSAATRATISPVPSLEPSSYTSTSPGACVPASAARTQRSIRAASSRAGMHTETRPRMRPAALPRGQASTLKPAIASTPSGGSASSAQAAQCAVIPASRRARAAAAAPPAAPAAR